MACSKRGGVHTASEQKRWRDKLAREVDLSLYEDAFTDADDLDSTSDGD